METAAAAAAATAAAASAVVADLVSTCNLHHGLRSGHIRDVRCSNYIRAAAMQNLVRYYMYNDLVSKFCRNG
jgi:hypothetical protein